MVIRVWFEGPDRHAFRARVLTGPDGDDRGVALADPQDVVRLLVDWLETMVAD